MNEPIQNLSFSEFLTPRISVSRMDGKIYMFFGETPRAQVSIVLANPMAVILPELEELKERRFPFATIEWQ